LGQVTRSRDGLPATGREGRSDSSGRVSPSTPRGVGRRPVPADLLELAPAHLRSGTSPAARRTRCLQGPDSGARPSWRGACPPSAPPVPGRGAWRGLSPRPAQTPECGGPCDPRLWPARPWAVPRCELASSQVQLGGADAAHVGEVGERIEGLGLGRGEPELGDLRGRPSPPGEVLAVGPLSPEKAREPRRRAGWEWIVRGVRWLVTDGCRNMSHVAIVERLGGSGEVVTCA